MNFVPGDLITPYAVDVTYESGARGFVRNAYVLMSGYDPHERVLLQPLAGEAFVGDPYVVIYAGPLDDPAQDPDQALLIVGRNMGWLRSSNVKRWDQVTVAFRKRFVKAMRAVKS